MTFHESIQKLKEIILFLPERITLISLDEFSFRKTHSAWSKKEILGHLVDSAHYNHERFIQAQFIAKPYISYNQNACVQYNFYQSCNLENLILLWLSYNRHLLHIMDTIDDAILRLPIQMEEHVILTFEETFISYVQHVEHHVNQILN